MASSAKWLGKPSKSSVSSFLLLFSSLIWYYMTLSLLPDNPTIEITYFITILISSFASPYLAKRLGRIRLLYVWMVLGVVASFLAPLFVDVFNDLSVVAFFVLGLAFGIGMPSCLTCFVNNTTFENRGKVAGIAFLSTILFMPVVLIMLEELYSFSFITLGVWRVVWLLVLLWLKIPEEKMGEAIRVSFKNILCDRSFMLYLVPWLMFNFVDQFESLILRPFFFSKFGFDMPKIGLFIGALSAFIGGYFSDVIGRKRVIIYGFVSLGAAFAAVSLASLELYVWYFYLLIEGIAWGIFYVNFIVVVWGDLARSVDKERHYVIGGIPFFSAGLLSIVLTPIVGAIPEYAAFSLASFFLFIAVLPLIYAPEPLPEKKIQERQMKKYVEEAKKVVGKRR